MIFLLGVNVRHQPMQRYSLLLSAVITKFDAQIYTKTIVWPRLWVTIAHFSFFCALFCHVLSQGMAAGRDEWGRNRQILFGCPRSLSVLWQAIHAVFSQKDQMTVCQHECNDDYAACSKSCVQPTGCLGLVKP